MQTLPQSFVGGELSVEMFGRPTDPKYGQGAALIRNAVVQTTGALRRMPGREFVRAARNPDRPCLLVPFVANGGEGLQVELGHRQEFAAAPSAPGYARLHRLGGTVLVNRAWNAATAYVVGDLVTNGGPLFCCRLAHTNQAPPNNTYWETLAYVVNRPFVAADVNFATDTITFSAAHGLETGEPIEFTVDASAAAALTTPAGDLRTGFALVVNATAIQVSAAIGGLALDLNGANGGALRMHRSYSVGELVSMGSTIYYCRQTRPIDANNLSIPANAGNEAFWYVMPATGEYEIPTTLLLTDAELLEITHSQNENVLRIATGRTYLCEVVAVPPSPAIQYLHWQWRQVTFAPPLPAPTGVVATATTRGDTIGIATVGNNGGAVRITTVADHLLTPGLDHVLIEGTGRPELDGRTFSINNAGGAARTFDPVDPATGAFIAFVAAAAAGTARVVRLGSVSANTYVVTAMDADLRESLRSATAFVSNNLLATGSANTVTWSAVSGAVRYRVYKLSTSTGLFGLLGEAAGTSFVDDGTVAPSLGITPPDVDAQVASAPNNFALAPSTATNLPRCVGHFQGRCVVAGLAEAGQDVWLTRSNTESDMGYSIPVKATDRIHQRLKTRSSCTVRHALVLGQLVMLTDTTAIRISPSNTDVLTPDSFVASDQSAIGASGVQPIVMHNAGLFAARRGGRVYAIGFREAEGGYVTVDQCERATHLFHGRTIRQLAAQMAPLSIAWAVGSDGGMRGLTFVPSQQVFAWHQHNAGAGAIESVSVGGEGDEDRVYVAVRRVINGATVRYIERTAPMLPAAWAESWHVDCGARYAGASVSTITTAQHLEGQTVLVWADGLEQTPKVVVGGAFTLDTPASTVIYGLALPMEVQTVPAAFQVEAFGQGKTKNVSKVYVRVEASGPFEVGPSLDQMEVPVDITPGQPFSGIIEVRVPGTWTRDGQLFIRAAGAAPLNIVSVSAEMALGGD